MGWSVWTRDGQTDDDWRQTDRRMMETAYTISSPMNLTTLQGSGELKTQFYNSSR